MPAGEYVTWFELYKALRYVFKNHSVIAYGDGKAPEYQSAYICTRNADGTATGTFIKRGTFDPCNEQCILQFEGDVIGK